MAIPCNCCDPASACRAVTTEILLDGAHTQVFNGTGVLVGGNGNPVTLLRWSDGDVAGANFTGYTSPAVQFTDATSPVFDMSFTVPQNGITGIREWNQGGGDLGDADGFASWDYTLFDSIGNVLLFGTQLMGNGGAPFTTNFPFPVNNVSRIRLSNMRKLNPGSTVSPLVREVRMLQTVYSTVFRCRDSRTGVVTWYDIDGGLVPNSQVTSCPPPPAIIAPVAAAPFAAPVVRVTTSFMGDDGGTGENLCNVVPAPTSVSGFTLVGACYDPVPGAFMQWLPGISTLAMTYDSNGSAASGASLFNLNEPSVQFWNWTANATPMVAGEQRISLASTVDGSFIRATQLPFTGPANGALRMDGGANLRIGPAVVSNFGAYPMLFEWLK